MTAQHHPVGEPLSLAVQVRQVEAALQAALADLLAEHRLGMEHWRILAVVGDEPGLGMSEVAQRAVVAQASLTRHTDRLVEIGLVVRRADPLDKRRVVVALSPRGQEYVDRVVAAERAALLPLPEVAEFVLGR